MVVIGHLMGIRIATATKSYQKLAYASKSKWIQPHFHAYESKCRMFSSNAKHHTGNKPSTKFKFMYKHKVLPIASAACAVCTLCRYTLHGSVAGADLESRGARGRARLARTTGRHRSSPSRHVRSESYTVQCWPLAGPDSIYLAFSVIAA